MSECRQVKAEFNLQVQRKRKQKLKLRNEAGKQAQPAFQFIFKIYKF